MSKLKHIIAVVLIAILFIILVYIPLDRAMIISYTFPVSLSIIILLISFYYPKNKIYKLSISGTIALIFIEITLSFISPYRSYSEKKGKKQYRFYYYKPVIKLKKRKAKEFDVSNEFRFEEFFNAENYRDKEIKKDSISVIFIGDSFVQGIGTDEAHKPDILLEKRIGCNDCVLNMGLEGSDLFFSYILLQNIIDQGKVNPQLVILNINNSDFFDLIVRSKKYNIQNMEAPSFMFEYLYGMSFIFRHLARSVFHVQWHLQSINGWKKSNELVKDEICKKIKEYSSYLESKNIRFLVTLQPFENELGKNEENLSVIEARLENDTSLMLINLYNNFNNYPAPEELYWKTDGHFNEKGYIKFIDDIYTDAAKKYPGFWQSIQQ